MRKFPLYSILPVFLAMALVGCGGGTNPPKETKTDSAAKNAVTATDTNQTAEDLPGLKELNEADRKLAEKQKVCPVSGSPLGTADMGTPYKMIVKGRTVFLCCKGCEESVQKDPDKYLKKLDAMMAKK